MTRTLLVLLSIGGAIITLGAYVAGGTDVTCSRVEGSTAALERAAGDRRQSAAAACVVRTKRWFGRHSIGEQTYPRVTAVDHIPGRRSGLFQLVTDGTAVAEIGATRSDAARAAGRLKEWLGGGARTPITIDFSEWAFAYAAMGFGALWLGAIALIARGRDRTEKRPNYL
jgi:hypothetical protein